MARCNTALGLAVFPLAFVAILLCNLPQLVLVLLLHHPARF
jgi:hypothetical protein